MNKILYTFAFSLLPLLPVNSTAWQTENSQTIYLKNTKGIALLANEKSNAPQNFEGVVTAQLTLPGPLKKLEARLIPLFYQKNIDEEGIQKIKAEIARFYAEYNHPFVQIRIPRQVKGGKYLFLIVEEAKVGSIRVEGNKHFSKDSILQFLRLKPGLPIDTKQMLSDLNLINRNPFRRVDVVYSAGQDLGTTDVTLAVQDRFPIRAYFGYDNTGVEPLGENRIYTGINWANAFNLGHILSLQYTTNPNHLDKFQSISTHYTAPLSWRHVLVVYGGYSWIESPPVPGLKTQGQTAQTSLRYQIPLPSENGLLHEFEFGGDWKWTNNEILFNSGGVISRYTNLLQFEVGYNLDYQTKNTNTTFDIEMYAGPGKWLPHESQKDYSLLRFAAKPSYFYTRSTLTEVLQLPKRFSIWFFLRGQYSTSNLLPSEQVGLGGYETIRGYEERTFNIDDAIIGNIEVRSPVLRFFDSNLKKKWRTELTFLGFFDYGYGLNHKGEVPVYDGMQEDVWLAGAGPGVRLNIGRFISLRFDWGIRINQSKKMVGPGWQHIHFALVGSY